MEEIIHTASRIKLIKQKLKSEFVGLDEIIDQFIDAVNPWCLMREYQNRPLVVNLWGMTGTGKTSLVKRFLSLWNQEEHILQFNLGSKEYFRDMMNSIEHMEEISGKPSVIIFDEFQHARTLSESRQEMSSPLDRMIWQLLDDGKFLFTKIWHDSDDILELIAGLELCLERGVKVEKGKIIEGADYYCEIFTVNDYRIRKSDKYVPLNFLSQRHIDIVFELVNTEFNFKPVLKDYIFQLDGPEILKFVKRAQKTALNSKEIDFSKSLVFVIGNLDEAFQMSGWMSADQDPDVLHLESKKITFSHIKEALRERFRLEEIARLGNIHLIYPALNSHYFKEFIDKELNIICLQLKKVFGVDICFSEAIKQMLFEEGVTPSQGFRPLRSSIRFLLESPLANLLSENQFNLEDRILVVLDEDELVLEQKNEVISKKKLFLPVKEARRKKLDSQGMAITAVHEAGHALVYMVLFGRLPKVVTIASSDHYVGGLISGESIVNFENLDFILRDAAVRLAGKKAEEIVFGCEQITTGASSDLQKATNVLIELSRSGTMSESFVAYESKLHGSGSLLPDSEREWKWVEEQLDNASVLSEKIIVRNMVVFQLLIKVLLEEKHLTSKKLSNILLDNGIDLVALMNSHPPLFDYLERLNKFFASS